jgi:hypothetical protein
MLSKIKLALHIREEKTANIAFWKNKNINMSIYLLEIILCFQLFWRYAEHFWIKSNSHGYNGLGLV